MMSQDETSSNRRSLYEGREELIMKEVSEGLEKDVLGSIRDSVLSRQSTGSVAGLEALRANLPPLAPQQHAPVADGRSTVTISPSNQAASVKFSPTGKRTPLTSSFFHPQSPSGSNPAPGTVPVVTAVRRAPEDVPTGPSLRDVYDGRGDQSVRGLDALFSGSSALLPHSTTVGRVSEVWGAPARTLESDTGSAGSVSSRGQEGYWDSRQSSGGAALLHGGQAVRFSAADEESDDSDYAVCPSPVPITSKGEATPSTPVLPPATASPAPFFKRPVDSTPRSTPTRPQHAPSGALGHSGQPSLVSPIINKRDSGAGTLTPTGSPFDGRVVSARGSGGRVDSFGVDVRWKKNEATPLQSEGVTNYNTGAVVGPYSAVVAREEEGVWLRRFPQIFVGISAVGVLLWVFIERIRHYEGW